MARVSHVETAPESDRRDPASQLAALVHSIGAIIWESDADRRFTFVSDSAEEILGYPIQRWLGEPRFWEEHVHPDDRETAMMQLGRACLARNGFQQEFRMIAADGAEVWLHDAVSFAPGGELRLRGVMLDITEQKRAQLALASSEERLRRAQGAARIGTFDWDVQTNELVWDGVEPIHGLPPGSFGGTFDAYLEDIHPDDRLRVVTSITSAIANASDVANVYRIIRPDGTTRWVEGRGRAITDESGAVVRVAGTCMDVTARQEADEAIRFQAHLLDAVGEAVIAADLEGRVRYWNRAAEAIYGWTSDEVMGRSMLEVTGPRGDPRSTNGIVDFARSGLRWEGEYACRTKSGESVLVHVTDSPIRDAAGNVVGLVGVASDISDRRAAEIAIEVSEKKYRTLANALPAMVSLARPDGSSDYYNTRWYEYTGMTERDTAAGGWRVVVHPDEIDDVMTKWEASLRSGASLEIEARVRRSDGEYRWHLGRTVPMFDAEGAVEAVVVTAVDIHDRRAAEDHIATLNAALARRIAELTAVLDVAPVGIGIAEDPDCRVIRANPAFARLLGISPDANASLSAPDNAMPFKVLQQGHEVAADDLPLQRAAQHGETIDGAEIDVLRADGTNVHLLEYASPMRDAAGTIIGSVGAFVDISERTAAERSMRFLARATEVLNATLDYEVTLRQLARIVVPELADWCGIDVLDETGNIRRLMLANADLDLEKRVIEIGREFSIDISGRSVQARVIRTGDGEFFEEVTDALINASSENAHQASLLRQAGIVSLACVPLVSRGTALGAITFVTAESRRKLGEPDFVLARELAHRAATAMDNAGLFREVQQRAADLKSAIEAKDEFLGLVSHELRTPITTIFGNAQVLRRRGRELDEESRATAIDDIEQEADRLHRIVENMLTLARVETGRAFTTEPVLARRVAQRLAEAHMLRFPHRTVTVDAPDAIGAALAEPTYLEQVIRNLLSNAEKYSPPDAPIDIVIRIDEHEVRVSVLDRGSGIDPGEAEDIFTAFYRSRRTSGQASGVGMGLAVCKRLVEAQSGRIWARPRDGGGSEIGFALPLVKEGNS